MSDRKKKKKKPKTVRCWKGMKTEKIQVVLLSSINIRELIITKRSELLLLTQGKERLPCCNKINSCPKGYFSWRCFTSSRK